MSCATKRREDHHHDSAPRLRPGRRWPAALTAAVMMASMAAGSALPARADPVGDDAPAHAAVAYASQGSGYDRDQVLTVDGQPYWYSGMQVRADKLRTQIGYRAEVPIEQHDAANPDRRSLEQIFKQVAEDGYNTVNVQVLWSDLQKDKVTTAAQTRSATISADGGRADTSTFRTGWQADDPAAQELGYVGFDLPRDVRNVDGAKVRLYVTSHDDRQTEFGSAEGMLHSHSLKLYQLPTGRDADKITWRNTGLGRFTYDGTDLKRPSGDVIEPVSVLPTWDPIKRSYFYDLDVTDAVVQAKKRHQRSVGFLVASSTPADQENRAEVAAETISFEPAQSARDDSDTNTAYLKQPLRPRLFVSDGSLSSIDWTYYDKLVRYAEKYGLRFEVVWFGSDSTGYTSDFRVPFYVFHKYQMTTVDQDPTSVLYNGSTGTPLFQKKVGDPNVAYAFLADRGDQELMKKEGDILRAIVDHTAELTDESGKNIGGTLIGVQTQNEPYNGTLNGTPIKPISTGDGLGTDVFSRSPLTLAQRDRWRTEGDSEHGNYRVTTDTEFRKYQVWYYNDYLSKRVKDSDLQVWTRLNHSNGQPTSVVDINEKMRATEGVGTYLDFVGIDTYGVGVGDMYKIGNGRYWFNVDKGDNIPMVMEDGMNVTNAAEKKFATVAGGALHNGYNACSFDGDALYDAFSTTQACGRTERPADARTDEGTPGTMTFATKISRVADTNRLLAKVGYDLATRNADAAGGTTLVYLNPTGSTAAGGTVDAAIRSLPITYDVAGDDEGVATRGFAIERSDTEVALGTTGATTIRLHGLAGNVSSAEVGSYDDLTDDVTDNAWLKEGDAVATVDGDDVVLSVPAYSVVRLVTSSPIPPAVDHRVEAESR